MTADQILVYGAHWCPDCRRAKMFLGEHMVPYQWIDIEADAEAEARVLTLNRGKRIIPTLVFPDGSLLVEPSNAELAAKLGLRTVAQRSHYDVVIVGGGPAGLTAALYLGREGLDALVIERGALGGQTSATQQLDNVPGFAEGIAGPEYARGLARQAERFGAELLEATEVKRLRAQDNYRCVCTADGAEYSARALLIASGGRYRRLQVPGEEQYLGAGIHFCATCDGPFYRGERVVVIGGGNSAAEETAHLLRYVQHVTLLVRGERLKASEVLRAKIANHERVTCRFGTTVTSFLGTGGKLDRVAVHDAATEASEQLTTAAAFVLIGLEPNTEFCADAGVRRNRWGYVLTGHDLTHGGDAAPGEAEPTFLETSVPGVFCAGDARSGSTKQVAAAAGEGATAALLMRDYLQRP